MRGWGGLHPIEDLPDGGKISRNDNCKKCLEIYSAYGVIEISAILQKFRWGTVSSFLLSQFFFAGVEPIIV